MSLQYATPSADVANLYRGERCSLEIAARKEAHGLCISSLVVTTFDYDGVPLVSYHFKAPLDEQGAAYLSDLCVEWDSGDDTYRLRKLLSITESYSCGDWMACPTVREGATGVDTLDYMPPEFNEYARNPEQLLRRFEYALQLAGVGVKVVGELAAWGEFFTLRYLELGESSWQLRAEYKILLPNDPQRSCQAAYQELHRMLRVLVGRLRTGGKDALTAALQNYGGTAYRISSAGYLERLHAIPGEARAESDIGERDNAHSVPVVLRIRQRAAEIAISAGKAARITGATILIETCDVEAELSAAQLRAIQELYEIVRLRHEPESYQQGAILLGELVKGANPSPARNLARISSWSTEVIPLAERLASLSLKTSIDWADPEYFFDQQTAHLIRTSASVLQEKPTRLTKELLQELQAGGIGIALGLPLAVCQRRPELIRRVSIVQHPGERWEITIHNGLGGLQTFDVRREISEAPRERRAIFGRIFRCLSAQEADGWLPLAQLLHQVGDVRENPSGSSGGPALIPKIPFPSDYSAVETLASAGQVLRLVTRGMAQEFWGFCDAHPDSSVQLALGRMGMEAVLAGTFLNSRLMSVAVRTRQTSASQSYWQQVVHLQHQGFKIDSDGMHNLVAALREFFRDQLRGRAVSHQHPDLFGLRAFLSRMAELGFTYE